MADYADIWSVLVNQTSSISAPYDDVSITSSYSNGSEPSEAFWRLVILLNQSQSGSFPPISHRESFQIDGVTLIASGSVMALIHGLFISCVCH